MGNDKLINQLTPINRRELFKEFRVKKEFGVGFYHRNHEYDTCDCWKESK